MRTVLPKIIAGRPVIHGAVHVSPSVLIPEEHAAQRVYLIDDPDKGHSDAEALVQIKELLRLNDEEFPDDIYFHNLQATHDAVISDIASIRAYDRYEAYCRDEHGLRLILDKVFDPKAMLEVVSFLDNEELHIRYSNDLLVYNGSVYERGGDARTVIPAIVSAVHRYYPVTVRTVTKKGTLDLRVLRYCHVFSSLRGYSYFFDDGVAPFPVFAGWLKEYSVIHASLTSDKNKDLRVVYHRKDDSTVTLTVEQVGSKERAIKEYMPQVSRTEPGGRLLPE